jgi:NAD(P)-dependent dehydrogenase (short-subunit alcohol dehydrogenase family)
LICTQCKFVINRSKNNLYEFKMSQQKVWFITGASRGFGPVWTEAVLKRGDKVGGERSQSEGLESFFRGLWRSCAAVGTRRDGTAPQCFRLFARLISISGV